MKLDAHKRSRAVPQPFIGSIIGVGEPRLPAGRESLRVDGIPMILRGNIAPVGPALFARLVLAAMAEFQFVRVAPRRQSQNLMTETNPKDRTLPLHRSAYLGDHLFTGLRVPRPIGNQHAVEFL